MVTPIPNEATSPAIDSPQRSRAPLTAEYGAVAGIPRTPPALDTRMMRPRPALRMDGRSALVSATGPKILVANIRSHKLIGASSIMPAAEIPALCTKPYGAPTASSIDFAAAVTDVASVRSSPTPIRRGSSTRAPVASRRRSMPASTDRIAATTRQPRRYRCEAEANPSPLDAPVMTTLRGSAILAFSRTPVTLGAQLDAGATVRQALLPGGPLTDRVRPLGAVLLVIPLRVIHFGLGVGPGAGDGCGQPAGLDRPEP